VPSRLTSLLAALAVVALAGCGADEPEAISTPSAPSVAPSSAASSSAAPTPAPSSAAPSSPSASPTASGSASPATAEDGAYATDLSLSEDGALSYVPLRWYAGDNAQARCREKKVKAEGAWCTEYYYEEAGKRKAAALTEATKVRLLNDDLKPAGASLTDLVQAIEDEVWPNYQIAVSGGRVTQITQVFTP
jgi:predicted small lipoprotein YifL